MALHPTHAISVCSGYGGIDLGLRLALGGRCRTILYCEREAYPASVLVGQMENGFLDAAPVWSNLLTLPAGRIIGGLDVQPSDVVLHGGKPCQPWSAAGQRRGAQDERWLWPAFWRIARESRVGWIFLENVGRFVSGPDSGLDLVLRDLSQAGWNAEWDLFSASACGAPHERQRVFLLAHAGAGRRGQELLQYDILERRSAPAGGGRHVGDAECAVGRAGFASWFDPPGSVGLPGGRPEASGGSTESGNELADAKRDGPGRRRRLDSEGCRLEERCTVQEERRTCTDRPRCDGEGDDDDAGYWPSRPGEEQHGWEPPRLVVYAKGARQPKRQGSAVQGQAVPENAGDAAERPEAESGMGGVVDGFAGGLDAALLRTWSGRISALGNGVMPIVAAVGYVTLHERLTGFSVLRLEERSEEKKN